MKITLKDGVVKEFDNAVSVLEIAKSISEGLARNACAGIVDGEVKDYVLLWTRMLRFLSVHLRMKQGKWHSATQHLIFWHRQ